MVDAMEKAQDAKLEELQRVRQLNLFLRSRMASLDERLKRKVGRLLPGSSKSRINK